jgi:hypothetical protein
MFPAELATNGCSPRTRAAQVNGDALIRVQALKELLGGGTGGDSPILEIEKSPVT